MMADEVLCYQFDDVVIDLRAGRVLRGGTAVSLEPKAFDLLVLLVSRSGELVTRQDLLDQVWAGVYVTDNAVARVVAQLRRALGDAARGARYIETVPTRGYRFIEPVTRVTAPSSPPGAAGSALPVVAEPPPAAPRLPASTAAAEPAPGPTPHPLWAAGLAALALVAILLAWRSQDSAAPRPAAVGARMQLTSSAALDAFPAWAPDGRTIAYASDRGASFEIFLREMTAGGERLALTTDGQHNVQPAWSPDGSQIAYHSLGRGGIWVVPRAGGAPRQLSAFGSRPAWSPDGTRLAFQSAPYTEPSASAFETFGPSSLWIVDASGGQARRVTDGWRPEGSHSRPTWFPDGRRLFFASQRLDTTAFWVVDLDSGALTKVLEAGARALDATLAPDGRSALYVRLDDHFDLWKLPLTSQGTAAGAPQLLLPPSELDLRHVAVHPSGRQIAYVAMATVSGLRSLPLHRDGVPAGPSVRIAEDAVRSARRPSFSPDARVIAFERQSAGGPPHLWLLDLVKGSVAPLTRGAQDARDPVWSRDGTQVFFESGDDERRVLQSVDPRDGRTRIVATLAGNGHVLLRPRVSPDGTRLAYTRSAEGQLEVWVRTLPGQADTRVARLGDGVAFPVWSPDGSALAVDVWRDGHAQVHVVDLASGRATQVSSGVDQAWVRSWSPDGTRLALAGSRDGRWNVWTVGRDGTAPLQLTTYSDEHHYVRNPEWSPRGDRMAYEFASFSGNVWSVTLR
jgi:Tol biopolymer transport system component/DNA-binding winged helix-turn-helix (wHTH) protein